MRLLLGSLWCCFALACGPTRPVHPGTDAGPPTPGLVGQPVAGSGGGAVVVNGGAGGAAGTYPPPPATTPMPSPAKLDAAAPMRPPQRDAAVKRDGAAQPDVAGGGGGNDLLYVIGSVSTAVSDTDLVDHLKRLGFNVTVKTDADVRARDADGQAAVLLSGSTALATTMASFPELPDLRTPVLVMDENLEPFLGMVGNGANDRGTVQGTEVAIPGNADRDLTAGLKGNVTVFNAQFPVSFGVPGGGAVAGATVAGKDNQLALYAYREGDRLANNARAPANRVFFFMRDSAIANLLTADGLKLFDAALNVAISR
jgi:hypothetical protein